MKMDYNVCISESLVERMRKLWAIKDQRKISNYVNKLLDLQISNIEEISKISTTESPFRVVIDPLLPGDELLVIDKTPDENVYVTEVIQEMGLYDPDIHLLLRDKDNPKIKFTVKMNEATAEYAVIGGWQEE